MKFVNRFDKIQTFREQEKEEAVQQYQHAMGEFELVAEKLYHLLKKKEDLKAQQEEKLLTGFSVQEMRQQQLFLQNLENSIHFFQNEVSRTRQKMNWTAEKVKEKNIEVRKVQYLVEKGLSSFMQHLAVVEAKEMDEISAQYFANKALR